MNFKIDLGPFQVWLMETCRCTASTVVTYSQHAGQLLREHGENPTEAEILSFLATLPSYRRQVFKTAWRRYAEFREASGSPTINPEFPDLRKGKRIVIDESVTHPLEEQIADLAKIIPIEEIPELRRNFIVGSKGETSQLRDSGGQVHDAPTKLLRAFFDYGREGGQFIDPFRPLVPEEPGSRYPMDVKRIKRIVDHVRAKRGQL